MLHLAFEQNVNDNSEYGNNGVVGAPANVNYVTGKVGKAIQFKGVDGATEITVPNSASLQFNQELTVTYWLRMDSHEGQNGYGSTVSKGIHTIFGKNTDNNNSMYSYLFTNSGGLNLRIGSQGKSVTSSFAVGEWVYVTQVIFSNNVKIYLNGVMQVNENLPTAVNFSKANNENLTIGRLGTDWYPLYGTLDEFRMYNKVLTDSEILALYQLKNN
ncbi:LamG domain-containing protein [Metabacillus fastidiosus]|uniref:LamG domain-containing protein n=1 Tax=Metabacillus fastidiosus TaxID=1458 RepID=UPI003D28684C